MIYYCEHCDNNSWNEPFEDGICDECYDKQNEYLVGGQVEPYDIEREKEICGI